METEEIQEEIEEEIVDELENEDELDDENETPDWMKDIPDEDENGTDQVPLAKHLGTKNKLRGQIGERDEEIERLKEENQQLKSSAKPIPIEPVNRPRITDFDSDEEYESAMDAWETQKSESQLSTFEQRKQHQEQVNRLKRDVDESVTNHYTRAEKLIKDHSISPEVYKQADQAVRKAIASVIPKNADAVVDALINVIGEGSEKTMFHLGRNKPALNNLRSLLVDDPTGLKASAYLGGLTKEIKGTTKRKSQAPAPSAQVNGDGNVTKSGAADKRKYDKAHKSGNIQQAYNIAKAARGAGIDTSKW